MTVRSYFSQFILSVYMNVQSWFKFLLVLAETKAGTLTEANAWWIGAHVGSIVVVIGSVERREYILVMFMS